MGGRERTGGSGGSQGFRGSGRHLGGVTDGGSGGHGGLGGQGVSGSLTGQGPPRREVLQALVSGGEAVGHGGAGAQQPVWHWGDNKRGVTGGRGHPATPPGPPCVPGVGDGGVPNAKGHSTPTIPLRDPPPSVTPEGTRCPQLVPKLRRPQHPHVTPGVPNATQAMSPRRGDPGVSPGVSPNANVTLGLRGPRILTGGQCHQCVPKPRCHLCPLRGTNPPTGSPHGPSVPPCPCCPPVSPHVPAVPP